MAVMVSAVVGSLLISGWHRSSPLVSTPTAALEVLKASSLYYNGAAWPWLQKERPALLKQEDRVPGTARERSFAQAVQNPKLFRQLDRQEHFDEALLVGSPSQYKPLLDHLLDSPDWKLAYLDHTSLIFHRGNANAWSPDQLATVRRRLTKLSDREEAFCLAQIAGKLIAVRRPQEARVLLAEAEKLHEKVAEIPATLALYHLEQGKWNEALAAADQALAIDREDLSALGSKAQALYSTKRFKEAYAISQRLIATMPDDPSLLFYHSKIAHQARAFQDETQSLRRLIELAQENERPVSSYRVYLGQSLASSGEGPAALEQFRTALADPELAADQRKFANECISHIKNQLK